MVSIKLKTLHFTVHLLQVLLAQKTTIAAASEGKDVSASSVV